MNTARPPLLARWLGTPLLRPLNDPAPLRELLSALNPMWALGQVRARLLALTDHGNDVRSYLLQPNRAWRGYRAGQHVLVEVEIDGVLRQRTFSISSTPGARRDPFVLTIKRQCSGGVTDWMQRRLQPGAVLRLSQAMGEFAVPRGSTAPAALLMLSAGSGITPVISVVRALLQDGFSAPVHFVHVCRTQEQALFDDELRTLSLRHPNLQLHRWISSTQGRFSAQRLQQLVTDPTGLPTLLCGPTGLMREIASLYRSDNALQRLVFEDFNGAMLRPQGDGHNHLVSGLEQAFTASAELPLLQAAEAAGLRPAHGCRIGICMTCQCTKLSGTVRNLRTGSISSQPGERIQLCVSVAQSDLELAP